MSKSKKRSKSKDWLEGYLEGLAAVSSHVDGRMVYKGLAGPFDPALCTFDLEDAEKEARSAWAKVREVPPSGLAAVEVSKLTTDTTETTEKLDNNPKEV